MACTQSLCYSDEHNVVHIIKYIIYQCKGAFHLVIQVDTNIILSFLAFNKKQRQNDTYADLCHQMESTLNKYTIINIQTLHKR